MVRRGSNAVSQKCRNAVVEPMRSPRVASMYIAGCLNEVFVDLSEFSLNARRSTMEVVVGLSKISQ